MALFITRIGLSLVFLALLGSTFAFAKGSSCAHFLAVQGNETDSDTVTENFISYLSALWAQQILTQSEFEAFTKSLVEKNTLIHPLSNEITVQSKRGIHRDNLQTYIEHSELLDKKKILIWAQQFLTTAKKVKNSKKQTEDKTQKASVMMEFIPVHFDELDAPKEKEHAEKEGESLASRSIEVMQTLVTQKMWMEEMGGENPSHFNKGGDYPVENISLWSAMEFANRISKKHGLKPFYNLDKLVLIGRAEDGSLSLDPKVYETPEARDEANRIALSLRNIEQAEGYRLPSLREELALYEHSYAHLAGPLSEVVWFRGNSAQGTREVGKEPSGHIAGPKEFSDIIGHLNVWVSENHFTDSRSVNIYSFVVGGSWQTAALELNFNYPAHRYFAHMRVHERNNTIGFRLVRNIDKSKDKRP